jgi:uncharacterized iron-regulated membrane protein
MVLPALPPSCLAEFHGHLNDLTIAASMLTKGGDRMKNAMKLFAVALTTLAMSGVSFAQTKPATPATPATPAVPGTEKATPATPAVSAADKKTDKAEEKSKSKAKVKTKKTTKKASDTAKDKPTEKKADSMEKKAN